MDHSETDYKRILDCIDPSLLNNQQWISVAMALKAENQPFELFDEWSAKDSREGQYRGTEYTLNRWESCRRSGITGATLTQMAREQGNDPFPVSSKGETMGWDEEFKIIDEKPISAPAKKITVSNKKPALQTADYLEALFDPADYVDIVTNSFQDKEGKWKPQGIGIMGRTVQEICDKLRKYADEENPYEYVFGKLNPEAGAWIRVNPTHEKLPEGKKGVSEYDITRYQNLLIECDDLPIDQQMAKIEELHLPYKAITMSGGKSVHAVIRIDAVSISDYKSKAEEVFRFCKDNGFPVDTQNCNVSRLTRIAGPVRGKQKQSLVKIDDPVPYKEWKAWAETWSKTKKLTITSFADILNDMPEPDPELIHGVLREGHKLLITGPSKAGKSFALVQLAIAIAEGKKWFGYQCEMGKVLYLNMEIANASFYGRIKAIYEHMGYEIKHPDNIDIMGLRGMSMPLDKLAPILEEKIKDTGYKIIVFDPIYKIITGDENSASDMAKFCNLFDEIARVGKTAIAMCHHHSKGSQANKSAIDRASGSGVFARDPDAILDLTEVNISDERRIEMKERMIESVTDQWLQKTGQFENLQERGTTDRIEKAQLLSVHLENFDPDGLKKYESQCREIEELGDSRAYRLSITLREFKSPDDRNFLFHHPVHVEDQTGIVASEFLVGDNSIEAMNQKKKEKSKKRADKRREWYDAQRAAGEMVSINDVIKEFGISKNTVRSWVDNHEDLKRENGWILLQDESAPEPFKKGRPKKGSMGQNAETDPLIDPINQN